MPRGPSRPHPPLPLAKAVEVAEAIRTSNAGKPMNRILLAEAMGYSPSSSGFRDRIMAAGRYGMTDGSYNSEVISLTPIGVSLTGPRNTTERSESLRDALRHVGVFGQLLDHFANAKLPAAEFLKNTLERDPFNVDPAWSEEVAATFVADAAHVGYLRDMSGSQYLVLDASAVAPERVGPPDQAEQGDPEGGAAAAPDANRAGTPESSEESPKAERPTPMQIFIAHGRNRKPLEQLKGILNEWQVPFLVAVQEANAGRPISQKVADTMKQCSAGIFILTADEELRSEEGEAISRPSQNVVYELGAASLLYGKKIVVLKERGVTFATDFNDLGWIEFDSDALDAQAMELLREMIALKAVRLVSSTA